MRGRHRVLAWRRLWTRLLRLASAASSAVPIGNAHTMSARVVVQRAVTTCSWGEPDAGVSNWDARRLGRTMRRKNEGTELVSHHRYNRPLLMGDLSRHNTRHL